MCDLILFLLFLPLLIPDFIAAGIILLGMTWEVYQP